MNIEQAKCIEGWMEERELEWLAEQASKHNTIVEIGSYLGRSTCALADNTEGRVFAFDDWKGIREKSVTVEMDSKRLFNDFLSNMNGRVESGKVVPLITDHQDTYKITTQLKNFGAVPDMVFIDGCHKYESVHADIKFWLKQLNGKGLLCGHDINWEDVYKAVQTLVPEAQIVDGTSLWCVDLSNEKGINKNGDVASQNPTIGLTIAIPFCGRPVSPEWAMALAIQNYPLNLTRAFYLAGKLETAEARNKAVEYAVQKKSKYIWFLDDDVQPPLFALRQLIYTLESADDDVMVVSGIYFTKNEPTEPVIYRGEGQGAFWKWRVNDKFEIDGCGAGCMLVNTKLFEKLEKPYFKTIDEIGDKTAYASTEDIYFCNKVKAAGYKILADASVLCNHWNVNTMKYYNLPDDAYPNKKESN